MKQTAKDTPPECDPLLVKMVATKKGSPVSVVVEASRRGLRSNQARRDVMKVEFLDPAVSDLIGTIRYYNGEGEGLDYEFAAEVNRTIGRIMEYPNAWALNGKLRSR